MGRDLYFYFAHKTREWNEKETGSINQLISSGLFPIFVFFVYFVGKSPYPAVVSRH